MSTPLISVNIIVLNGAAYISRTIDSILAQSFSEWEMIIVDDGSTDKTVEVVRSYTDPRIKLLLNEENKGIVYTRNRAIRESSGKYIAINDADDLALPDRLEKQFAFLERNPEYAFVGCNIHVIDEHDKVVGNRWEIDFQHELIPGEMFFRNVFVHSAVMFRRAMLPEDPYLYDYTQAEDYELFTRLLEKHKAANLPDVCTYYRIHSGNITQTNSGRQKDSLLNILRDNLIRLGESADKGNIELLFKLLYSEGSKEQIGYGTLRDGVMMAGRMIRSNRRSGRFIHSYFVQRWQEYWNSLAPFHLLHQYGWKAFRLYKKPFYKIHPVDYLKLAYRIIKK